MAGASHYTLASVAPPQTTAGASAPPLQSPSEETRLASGQDMYGLRSDVPPNYSTLPDAPPPSYEAMFGQVKQIQKDSMEKVGSWVDITLKTCMCMGVLFFDACPAVRMIPIYLLVAGSTTTFYFLAAALHRLIENIQKRRNSQAANQEAANPAAPPVGEGEVENNEEKKKDHPCLWMIDGIMFLFLFSWFITGNVYIYSAWRSKPCDVYNCDPDLYCEPYLLLFTFWLITFIYIMCGCCTCTCICIGVWETEEKSSDPSQYSH